MTDLLQHIGERRELQRTARLPDVAVVAARVDPERDVVADLLLDAIPGAVVVTGRVRVPWIAECRRCLVPIIGEATVRVREVFDQSDEDPDAFPLEHEEIDLEPLLRDVAMGALPLAPLCGEDCRGPAPDQFPTGVAPEVEEVPDPRWAALDDITFDD